jgi:hypothetical protein
MKVNTILSIRIHHNYKVCEKHKYLPPSESNNRKEEHIYYFDIKSILPHTMFKNSLENEI